MIEHLIFLPFSLNKLIAKLKKTGLIHKHMQKGEQVLRVSSTQKVPIATSLRIS